MDFINQNNIIPGGENVRYKTEYLVKFDNKGNNKIIKLTPIRRLIFKILNKLKR